MGRESGRGAAHVYAPRHRRIDISSRVLLLLNCIMLVTFCLDNNFHYILSWPSSTYGHMHQTFHIPIVVVNSKFLIPWIHIYISIFIYKYILILPSFFTKMEYDNSTCEPLQENTEFGNKLSEFSLLHWKYVINLPSFIHFTNYYRTQPSTWVVPWISRQFLHTASSLGMSRSDNCFQIGWWGRQRWYLQLWIVKVMRWGLVKTF